MWNRSGNATDPSGNGKKAAAKPFASRGLLAAILAVAVGISAIFWLIKFFSQDRGPVDTASPVPTAAEPVTEPEPASPVAADGEATGESPDEEGVSILARRHMARRRMLRRKFVERQDSLPPRDQVDGEESKKPQGTNNK